MNTPDRLGLVKRSLRLLLARLNAADRVAIVQFSSHARLLLEHTPVAQQAKILAAIDGLQCSGYTHLEGGLHIGYQTAAKGFRSGAANRVLLMSDGVANLGTDAAAEILLKAESFRKQGIYCSVFGFGQGTYDDTMLLTLADKGNGSYHFIDSVAEAQRVLVDDLAATLNTIASDVKIQVEFNARRVKQYRQLGYEKRKLQAEDFRNDAVDAGEVGSGQSATALYEIELQSDSREPMGVVRVRYRNLETGHIEEVAKAIAADRFIPRFEQADLRFRLAAVAAEFAEILRASPYAEGDTHEDVAKVLRPVALELRLDQRVQELLRLVHAAPGLPQAQE
jgi:Ca-activated chloride channel family protein